MSPSARLAFLMLSACTLPLSVTARASDASAWVYGVSASDEAAPDDAKSWLVDFREIDGQGLVRPQRRRNPTPPPPPPPPPPGSGNNTGAGVLVAVVDTGIFLTHSEFSGRIAAGGTCFGGSTVCTGTAAQGNDNHGHGTHVAGIIAAASNGVGNTGVAPGASLLAVKVLDAAGSGTYTAVGQGISYAASKNAKIISMSLGGGSPSSTLIAPLQQAAVGSVIVAAAGNSGNALAPGWPAAYATQAGIVGSMLIVGSVNAQNVISSFSQTPGSGGCVASGGTTKCFKDVFLVAPGENIYSTYKGGAYATMSGTSMATPYVSGVAARVLGAAPYLTNKQVVSILLQSATDLGASGIDGVYGSGLVNLTSALQPLGTQTIATAGATTSGFSGSGGVSGSSVSGVLGNSIRRSNIAKNVMFFDAFGRDYVTDLSGSVGHSAVSLAGLVAQDRSAQRYVSAFGDGYSVSGFVADEAQNGVASASFTDQSNVDISDVVVTARLSDTTSMTFGHNASLSGRVNQLDLSAGREFDGLFMSASALNSPFLSLTGSANFVSAAFNSGDDLTFSFGHAVSEDDGSSLYDTSVLASDAILARLYQEQDHPRSAENTVAAMSWKFAPWGTAGLNAAYTQEENSLLGTTERGALALTAHAATTSIGVGARFDLGDNWAMSASWSAGQTDAAPVAGSLFQSVSTVQSQAYGLALSKTGIFSDTDSFGVSVSRPLHITSGTAVIHASTGVTEGREIIYSDETVQLASSTPETDFEVGYTAKLSDDVTMQANVMYQQNAGGEAGSDAIAGLVTLKTQW